MAEMTAGTALRQLQQAQAGLRKARQVLREGRGEADDPDMLHSILEVGWESLAQAHRTLGAIPLAAANEAVMTRQLAVERYATALLVRLRRLARRDPGVWEEADEDLEAGE